jgi:hypothetical protein
VKLDLEGPGFTDAAIRILAGKKRPLDKILLKNAGVTDAGLPVLAKNPKLTDVVLLGTKVTPAGVAALQQALPKCKIEWPSTGKFYAPPTGAGK